MIGMRFGASGSCLYGNIHFTMILLRAQGDMVEGDMLERTSSIETAAVVAN